MGVCFVVHKPNQRGKSLYCEMMRRVIRLEGSDIGNMVQKVGQLVMDGKFLLQMVFLLQMIYGSHLNAAGGDAESEVLNSLKFSD